MKKRATIAALPLVLFSSASLAAHSHGNAALALAAFIGENSPTLSRTEKAVLIHFLGGRTNFELPHGVHRIVVQADKIRCRMGNVSLALHSCEITYGTKTITQPGRTGQALLATMLENTVNPNGTAGTIYYSVAQVRCTVDADEIQSNDGGGAQCEFKNAP